MGLLACVAIPLILFVSVPFSDAGSAGALAAPGNTGSQETIYPGISRPNGIASGSDGALWFTNVGNNSIGRITTSGAITDYTGTGIKKPEAIIVGPDGALWFTNTGNNSIGLITT